MYCDCLWPELRDPRDKPLWENHGKGIVGAHPAEALFDVARGLDGSEAVGLHKTLKTLFHIVWQLLV